VLKLFTSVPDTSNTSPRGLGSHFQELYDGVCGIIHLDPGNFHQPALRDWNHESLGSIFLAISAKAGNRLQLLLAFCGEGYRACLPFGLPTFTTPALSSSL
jgi:hypothetical protein